MRAVGCGALLAGVTGLAAAWQDLMSKAGDIRCGSNKADVDAECKATGTVCILAMDPPVCKHPLDKGTPCKRDKVCKSGSCAKPAGKDVGACA